MELDNDKNFHHPYTPYDIQLQFMRALYACIEEGKVGIFESPTGTGKSLSLICGSLTWLRDHKRREFVEDIEKKDSNDDEPEWILEHSRRERKRAVLQKRRKLEERLARIRAEEERKRKQVEEAQNPSKKLKSDSKRAEPSQKDDNQFELDDYDSEDEQSTTHKNDEPFSTDTLALLEKLKGSVTAKPDEDDEPNDVKVFYCSRTHSQLTQFAQEMSRVTLPPSVPADVEDGDDTEVDVAELEEGLKHIALGSRKALCINPKVQALGNPVAINERCLDLQKPGISPDHKCPYLPSKDNEAQAIDFRDHALAEVRDIEDIGKIGHQMGLCPYYASRSVVKSSEVITLPYPLLLQKSAREALNISLKDHVIIIDEAHNLMDVISNIHSTTVSLSQLQLASSQLTTYARIFKTRLKGNNRVYVAQVIRLVASITSYLQSVLDNASSSTEGTVQISDLMSGKGIDQVNPHKLSKYLHESKLARKVDGYIEHSEANAGDRSAPKQAVPVLFQVQSFLLPLMNPSAEGKLFYEKSANDVQLKYLLLDPTNHFRETVEEARAVILAGGTMSPMDDYIDRLFSYLEADRLRTFSYGHVIPRDNLTAAPILTGIHDVELDFTYGKRNDEKMVVDLGKTVMAICNVIPDGVVVFYPSYEYLDQVVRCWKKPRPDLDNTSILDQVEKRKAVFHEPLDRTTTNSDDLLQQYSSAVDNGSGALLLSVMGGKLSEGINFSDRLGRGVIVVGLPFPNIRSAVWQAKLQHVEQKASEACDGTEENKRARAKTAGREFYENACMRTVNQCIGRAIRHQHDYAAILMLDRRYSTRRIQRKLPSWIQESLVPGAEQSTRRIIGGVASFFHRKRNLTGANEKKGEKH